MNNLTCRLKEQAVYGHCKVSGRVSSKNNLIFQIVPTCEKSEWKKRAAGDNTGIDEEGEIFIALFLGHPRQHC